MQHENSESLNSAASNGETLSNARWKKVQYEIVNTMQYWNNAPSNSATLKATTLKSDTSLV